MKIARCAILLCVVAGMFGQEPPARFEAASVKPNAQGLGGLTGYLPDGGIRFVGVSVRGLVENAYGVRAFQVVGGPGWIDTEAFDIEARPPIDSAAGDPASLSREQRKVGERLRSLLADRFGLIVHSETTELPVYDLVAAKGGPKLKESAGRTPFIRGGRGSIVGQSVGVRLLVVNLSNVLDRLVVDKTGLTGSYDFELKWTPDVGSAGADGPLPASDADVPSLFTAVSDQLGLRLESARGPVQVWVIDGVERPTVN